jgi:hypothetical protein
MTEDRQREVLTLAQRGLWQQLTPLEIEVLILESIELHKLRRLMQSVRDEIDERGGRL